MVLFFQLHKSDFKGQLHSTLWLILHMYHGFVSEVRFQFHTFRRSVCVLYKLRMPCQVAWLPRISVGDRRQSIWYTQFNPMRVQDHPTCIDVWHQLCHAICFCITCDFWPFWSGAWLYSFSKFYPKTFTTEVDEKSSRAENVVLECCCFVCVCLVFFFSILPNLPFFLRFQHLIWVFCGAAGLRKIPDWPDVWVWPRRQADIFRACWQSWPEG